MTASDPADLARFLTLADTAEVLSVSVKHAYSLVRSGEIPAIRLGGRGRWRIERSVLEGYIAAMYEENRRRRMWEQAEFADVVEMFER